MDRQKYVNDPAYREGYDEGVKAGRKAIAGEVLRMLSEIYKISEKLKCLINNEAINETIEEKYI